MKGKYQRVCLTTPIYKRLIILRNKLTKKNQVRFSISATIQHLINEAGK